MPKKVKTDRVVVATNRRARHNFHILETFEAGISLQGPEVKSLRLKQASMDQSFARVDNNEVFLHGLHIAPYAFNTLQSLDPVRTRKLLLKQKEIRRLCGRNTVKGTAIIPLEIYFRRGWAKVLVAIARGKQGPDKRESIKRRDTAREMQRDFREKYKG